MKTFYVELSGSPQGRNTNNLNRFRFVFMAMIVAVVFPAILFAQAPVPGYSGPQNYVINHAITPLYPSNSGGAVAAPGYSSSKSTIFSGASYVVFDRDAAGNLYAFDYSNTSNIKLVKLSSTGSLLATYLTFMSRPEDIEVDAAGNIFVLDASTLYKITSGGTVSTLSSTLFNANGLALDAADNVYVAEYNTSLSSVIEVPADGSSMINIGSGLSYMTDVAVDAAGNVYVCNDGDASIKKIPAGGGSAVTIASSFTSFNTSDLTNIIVDGVGDIFFTERNGSKVSEIPAGTNTPVLISSGYFAPAGLALDLAGNLYIGDNGSLYKVAPVGGYYISPALPSGLSFDSTTGIISGTPTVLSAATNYTITASNSSGSTSTVISIAVLVSSPTDANLSSLTVGTGTLTPSFSPTTYSYTVEIPNSSIYEALTPTTDNNLQKLSTPGGALSSGFTTTAGPLAVGLNTVYFNVLAQDGATKNVYSVGITRDAPATNTINSIAATSTYSNASAIQFTATFAASITGLSASNFSLSTTGAVSGASVASVSGSGTTYTITVNTGTGDGTIGLNLSNATGLTPGISTSLPFTGGMTTIDKTPPVVTISAPSALFINKNSGVTYTVTFSDTNPNSTSIGSVNLPTIVFANKTITGDVTIDEISASGSNPKQLLILAHGDGTLAFNLPAGIATDLAGNANAATTLTTACTIDDTAPTVTIGHPSVSSIAAGAGSVTYAVTYADANFASSSLVLSNIHLNTTGNATGTIGLTGSGTSYTVTISNITGSGTIGINIAAGTATDAAGNTDNGAGPSATFNVLNNDAKLLNFTISNGTLAPGFSAGTFTYNTTIANFTSSITVVPTADDPNATITVDGNAATSGVRTSPIPMNVGANTLTIVVTAEDGVTKQTYTITINRPLPNNALLTSIALSPKATLVSAAGPDYLDLTAAVANGTSSIQVLPTAQDNLATITVNGQAVTSGSLSQNIPLNVGANTITTIITAEDGSTSKTAVIIVNRQLSAIASLSNLAISTGALSPAFTSGTLTYTASVPYLTASVTLTPTATGTDASVTVNGNPATTPVALSVGLNKIITVITAQNGITKTTYITYVTRAAASTNALYTSIVLNPVSTLISTTGPGYLNFKTNVFFEEASVQVIAAAKDPAATITVNGQPVTSGSPSQAIALSIGANTITTVITAQDGTTSKTAFITVNRAAPANDDQSISVTKSADNVVTEDDGIAVHQAVSPNGDGINDFFTIDGISNYPDNNLVIVDRSGVTVYQTKGYDNSSKLFDGHSNVTGRMQLPGTYFYSLDYTANGENKHKTGFIILKY